MAPWRTRERCRFRECVLSRYATSLTGQGVYASSTTTGRGIGAATRWPGCHGVERSARSRAVGDLYTRGACATRITNAGEYVVKSPSHIHRASMASDFGVASAFGHGGRNRHVGAAGRRGVMAEHVGASSASAFRRLSGGQGFPSGLEEAIAIRD